jgi:hypothetical protein
MEQLFADIGQRALQAAGFFGRKLNPGVHGVASQLGGDALHPLVVIVFPILELLAGVEC